MMHGQRNIKLPVELAGVYTPCNFFCTSNLCWRC